MNNEVKEIFIIRIPYMNGWGVNKEKLIRIYDRYKVDKETNKCYMTTTGKYFRKVHVNNPKITYGGEIEVITTVPYLNDEMYDKIKQILTEQYTNIKNDLEICGLSLEAIERFREVKENA